ncbi:MAG TPA: hypothetical protein DCY07_03065 [Rhodospirillaceae bacterium]|nr:hypothetical protein [Rhodospirillaceae bacterium]
MKVKEKLADLTESAIEALRKVYDPELPVNIYDLGLVYKIEFTDVEVGAGEGKTDLLVEMTLTTANCPLADMIPGMVYDALRDHLPDLNKIDVKLVWEPAWDPSLMSEDARFALDMM